MKNVRRYQLLFYIVLTMLSLLGLSVEARQIREVPDNIVQCDVACMQFAYPYALLSQDVYEDNRTFDKQGWIRGTSEIIFDFPDDDLTFFMDSWVIKDDDGLHMALYMNRDERAVALAVRGTEFNSLSDILTDLQQVFGAIPEQYENALTATQTVLPYIQQMGYRFFVVGHSLGGGIAQYVANSLNLPAMTFNTAPISKDVEQDSFVRKYPNGIPADASPPIIYNLVFRREGGWWSSYDTIADSYSNADSGGLLGASFSLVIEDDISLLELHSLDKMIEEMQRHIEQ